MFNNFTFCSFLFIYSLIFFFFENQIERLEFNCTKLPLIGLKPNKNVFFGPLIFVFKLPTHLKLPTHFTDINHSKVMNSEDILA